MPAPKLVLRWGEGGSCLSGFCSGKLALSSIRRIFLNGDWDSLRKRVCVCLCVQGCVLGGWEGGSRGRGYGDICIHIADSLCYTAETNTTL